eukprot:scaffold680067_cov196-Prasinocladus_malaysianus.AAC.1
MGEAARMRYSSMHITHRCAYTDEVIEILSRQGTSHTSFAELAGSMLAAEHRQLQEATCR